jgi:hypothetical protein
LRHSRPTTRSTTRKARHALRQHMRHLGKSTAEYLSECLDQD